MLALTQRLNSTKYTREDLLKNVQIKKLNVSDLYYILKILVDCFKIPSMQSACDYILRHKVNLFNSLKLVDKRDNQIYGLLLLGEVCISDVSPLTIYNPMLSVILSNLKQLNGVAFIIDERLRGCGLDKKMLYYNMDYINQFDMVWCGVDENLKTHNYWKRNGFFEILNDRMVKFYFRLI